LPAQDALQQRLQEQREQRNLGAQHHALLRFRDVTTAEDYVRPNYFPLRIALLLFFVCLTAEALALIFFFVPGLHIYLINLLINKNYFITVTIGRILLSWLALTNQPVHDLYTGNNCQLFVILRYFKFESIAQLPRVFTLVGSQPEWQ
jgi:hypothetical protein